jgi:prophage regulatory protein
MLKQTPNEAQPQNARLLKLPDVMEIVHYAKPSIYRLMAEGKFPKPIKLGGRSVFWVESEIRGFVQQCIEDSKEEAV